MHPSAADDFRRFTAKYLNPSNRLFIADVGSRDENGTLKELLPSAHNWRYAGYDIQDGPNVDVVLPCEDGWGNRVRRIYDVVVSSQTIEHVRRPWRWINDVVELMRDGAILYVCTPNTIEYHPYPIDCFRFWPDGLRALLEDAGLEVLECYANGMDTTGIARNTK